MWVTRRCPPPRPASGVEICRIWPLATETAHKPRRSPAGAAKVISRPSRDHERPACNFRIDQLPWRPPSGFINHSARVPSLSDTNAICWPSSEMAGRSSSHAPDVRGRASEPSSRAVQRCRIPVRDELNTRRSTDRINRRIQVASIAIGDEFHRTEILSDVDTNQRLVDVIQSTRPASCRRLRFVVQRTHRFLPSTVDPVRGSADATTDRAPPSSGSLRKSGRSRLASATGRSRGAMW